MEQAVHIAMMEPYNISADWNMGSPTSERLPTWQGKVGREWIKRSMPTHFTTVIIHPIWGENRLKTA